MSKKVYLPPAKLIILLFGGVRPVSRLVGIAQSAVSNWQKSEDQGVPRKHHVKLLDLAKQRDIILTAEDLVFGRNLTGPMIATMRLENNIDKRVKT